MPFKATGKEGGPHLLACAIRIGWESCLCFFFLLVFVLDICIGFESYVFVFVYS